MLTPKPCDHRWIESHIPHQGGMCLLEEVLAWDEMRIHCRAVSHRAADNPLRAYGRLGAACGIEYAAQAMAVHGALTAAPGGSRARSGFLVSVRGAHFTTARLDTIADDLDVVAACASRSGHTVLYEFTVGAAGRQLVSGRATVVLDAAALKPGAAGMAP